MQSFKIWMAPIENPGKFITADFIYILSLKYYMGEKVIDVCSLMQTMSFFLGLLLIWYEKSDFFCFFISFDFHHQIPWTEQIVPYVRKFSKNFKPLMMFTCVHSLTKATTKAVHWQWKWMSFSQQKLTKGERHH